MRPPVRGFGPQQPRGAADPSATRPAFMNNPGSEPNSPGLSSGKVAKLDALVGHFKKQRSLFDHFADHPLIGKRPDQPQQQTNRAYISGSFPSYLTATTFAQAVVDILTPGKASVSVDDIRDATAALPDCNFRRSLESLLKVAGGNLDKLRRVSG